MTKKNGDKTNEKMTNIELATAPSAGSNRVNRRRHRQSTDERPSRSRSHSRPSKKIRKNGKGASKKSSFQEDEQVSSSFSFTPSAIEFMTMETDIRGSVDNKPGESSRKSKGTATKNIPRNGLVFLLRIDLPPPVSAAAAISAGKQTHNHFDEEEQAALFGTLGDGKSSIRVMVLNPDGAWSKRLKQEKAAASDNTQNDGTTRHCYWIIKVHGYAATEKFWHAKHRIFPIVCLTSISVLETRWKSDKKSLKEKQASSLFGKPLFSNSGNISIDGVQCSVAKKKAQGGNIGTFLKERGPFLTNEELAGSSKILDHQLDNAVNTALNDESNTVAKSASSMPPYRDQNFKRVHECLSRHAAMLTLQLSSSSSSTLMKTANANNPSSSAVPDGDSSYPPPVSPTKSSRPTQHAWELYDRTLKEFKSSQMDRQKASLGTNAGRESAERAELLAERHNAVLELALKEDGSLSVGLLVSPVQQPAQLNPLSFI